MAASVEQICHFLGRIPPHILDPTRQLDLHQLINRRIDANTCDNPDSDDGTARQQKLLPLNNKRRNRLKSAASSTSESRDHKSSTAEPSPREELPITRAKSPLSRDKSPHWDANNAPQELFTLYTEVIREIPHYYETKIGKLKCIVHTNCKLSDVNICVIFLHGLGASPWHFIKVSSLFFESLDKRLLGARAPSHNSAHGFASSDGTAAAISILHDCGRNPVKAAFIYPFAPNKMRPGEFGAVDDSVYGSYKWWDIVATKGVVPDDEDNNNTTAVSAPELQKPYCGVDSVEFESGLAAPTVLGGGGGGYYDHLKRSSSPAALFQDSIKTFVMSPDKENYQVRIDHHPTASSHLEDLSWPHPMLFCCGKLSPTESPTMTRTSRHVKEEYGQLENPAGRTQAVNHVLSLFRALKRDYSLKMDKIAISGFSQGAMLALDVLHYVASPPLMAGLFSAAPMCVELWKKRLASLSPHQRRQFSTMPILQSHGTHDWVFPVFVGRWLRRFLVRQQWSVKFVEFDGDHELPASVMSEFHRMLYNLALKTSQSMPPLDGLELAIPANYRTTNDDNIIPHDDNETERQRRAASNTDTRPLWERFDDLVYSAGYALASCVLPVANRIC